MVNNLLAIVAGDGSYWAGQQHNPKNFYFDNIGEAAIYALLGFAVVFVGILFIIGIIWLVGLIMRKTNNLEFLTKKREKKPAAEKSSASAAKEKSSADSGDIPDEVKVAITAAIMAYYENSEEKCQFKVKRIKRL